MANVNTLQNICEVKIAVMVANHEAIKNLIFSSQFTKISGGQYITFKDWNIGMDLYVDDILEEFSSGLGKKINKFLIVFVAIQMWRWGKFHNLHFYLPYEFINDFLSVSLFTSKGCINEEKAARELVKESRISSFMQYKIACHYYLDDIIPDLWQEFRHIKAFKIRLMKEDDEDSVVLWSEYLEEKERANTESLLICITESFLVKAFRITLDAENVAGVKYCWRAMTPSKRILDSIEDFKASRTGERYISVHDCGWMVKLSFLKKISYYVQLTLIKVGFEKIIYILEFFLLELKKGECKDFLHSYNQFHELLYYLLRWPYQHLFLRVADYAFEVVRDEGKFFDFCFSGKDYYSILHNIVDLSRDPNFCRTYDYPYLFKEFWGRSPECLKNEVFKIECERIECPTIKPSGLPCCFITSKFLLEKLILQSNVTFDDEYNFRLILEYANSEDKTDILKTKGKNVCQKLISDENFRLANLFLESLNLDEETLITFKKSFISLVFEKVLAKESIPLAEQFVRWGTKSDDVDNFKKEIFPEVFEFPKIMNFLFHCQMSFDFLNKIYKWLFLNDEKLEYWKSNIIFDQVFVENYINMTEGCSLMLDLFFKFLGYSVGKMQDVKREILLKAMPHIIHKLVERYAGGKDYASGLDNKILYLCLYNNERINELANYIQTWCQDYVELKMCLVCRNSNHVYHKKSNSRNSNKKKSKLYCKLHDIKIMLPEDVDKICSSITDDLTKLMKARKKARQSLKSSHSHLENQLCQGLCNLEIVDHCKNCKK